MDKPEMLWPGARLKEFFNRLIARETSIPADVRHRLADRCARQVNRMLIWSYPEPVPAAPQDDPVTESHDPEHREAVGVAPLEEIAPWPEPVDLGEVTPVHNDDSAFDPYAFSVIAVYKRDGPDALLGTA